MKTFLLSFFLLVSFSLLAQEIPPPAPGGPPQDQPGPEQFLKNPDVPFTGTLADDDPANSLENPDLFGNGETPPDGEEPGQEAIATHLLKFDFTGRVRFINQGEDGKPVSEEPYMEIEYNTRFDQVVTLSEGRLSFKTKAEYDINNWGSLARNEFFDCRLDISMQEMPVEITTRINKTPAEEKDAEPILSLALKIDFSQDSREDWFSFCTDTSGATLNTEGEPEEYNLKVLRAIEPSLKGLVVDDFDRFDTTKIDLMVPQSLIDDKEIANDITYSGKGSISLEPL